MSSLNEKDEEFKKEFWSLIDTKEYEFYGMAVENFNKPSNSCGFKNPFYDLKKIALDISLPFDDRCRALRYMQSIDHIHMIPECRDALLKIIKDNNTSLNNRFFLFSNKVKSIFLKHELADVGYRYWFYHQVDATLEQRILCAQYILGRTLDRQEREDVQNFLRDVAEDTQREVHFRADAADILDRMGYGLYRAIGREVILELGKLGNKERFESVYTNAQNVHEANISSSMKTSLQILFKKSTSADIPTADQLYDFIIDKIRFNPHKERILSAVNRLLIDTAIYEGHTVLDILLIVWSKIKNSPHKEQLEVRMIEELSEMNKTCSTGHLSRVLNILSGFDLNIQSVKISFHQQLKSNIFARLKVSINMLPEKEQEQILEEMTEETRKKNLIFKFLNHIDLRKQLHQEFVTEGYMQKEEFKEVYISSIKEYFGIS